METVVYDPMGGPLFARAIMLGLMNAEYEILLRERKVNHPTWLLLSGDNLNPQDDITSLPSPPEINEGRRVILRTGFVARQDFHDPRFEIRLEIIQDGVIIGLNTDSGELDGKGQYSLLFIKLVNHVI